MVTYILQRSAFTGCLNNFACIFASPLMLIHLECRSSVGMSAATSANSVPDVPGSPRQRHSAFINLYVFQKNIIVT